MVQGGPTTVEHDFTTQNNRHRSKTHEHKCSQILETCYSSVIHNSPRKGSNLTVHQMNKQNVICPHNQMSLSIKRNEVPIHTSTQMNLENITLSKRSQSQTTTYLYNSTHIYGNIPKCKSTEIENRLVAGRRQGDRQVTAEWYRASFRDGEKSSGSLW